MVFIIRLIWKLTGEKEVACPKLNEHMHSKEKKDRFLYLEICLISAQDVDFFFDFFNGKVITRGKKTLKTGACNDMFSCM